MSLTEVITQDKTARWHDARLGRFTASVFHELICANGKPTQTMRTRCAAVAAEIVTGMESYSAQTKAMEWGIEMEEHAFNLLSEVWTPLEAATFVPFGEDAGCTPDAYAMLPVGLSTVDIKNPFNSSNFVQFAAIGPTWEDLKGMGKEGHKYAWQIATQARFCGTELCSIAYVDGRMPVAKRAIWRTYPVTAEMVEQIDEALAMARIERDRFLEVLKAA